jgi:hypothetical protein
VLIGHDTRALLKELGYPADVIDDLLSRGVLTAPADGNVGEAAALP